MKAPEQYFPVVLFTMLYKLLLPLSLCMKFESIRSASSLFSYRAVFYLSRFVQSLEFLKKYANLQTSFPDQEKVWNIIQAS